ncbi:hypothetical protein FB45DRAFT_991463 [Roridomyces roridus]|uniref:BTB domain-containing protein n=1 Tax=Roridomyces roridus TaxID=1738132 RepID=A0AAD7BN17_9AGAR|nr:hypothetical protein FB45DRAFT_991463 [Roridomyces roridus]
MLRWLTSFTPSFDPLLHAHLHPTTLPNMGASPAVTTTPAGTPTRRRSHSRRRSDIVRCPDLWFHDGNVVIIAGSIAFKVHRGPLERHSEVFDTLFSIPQPKDQDLYEGCPWLEVYDCPSDVLYFLKALYDGLYFKSPGANDFPAVAAVLRLSTKYLVEHLRQRCMSRLSVDWPSTLAGWEHREQAATDSLGHYAPRASCPHPILVIDLALNLNLTSLLPAAFYDLARYGPSKIMVGTPPAPYSLLFDSHHGRAPPPPALRTLSPNLLVKTLRGRERAQRFLADFVITELQGRTPAADCLYLEHDPQHARMCRESFYFIMLNVLRSVGGIACGRDADPLFTLVQAVDMLSRTDFSDGHRQCGLKLCHPCKVDFAAAATRAREEVWRLLPEWFELKEFTTTFVSSQAEGSPVAT